ncbi:MAG TPA: MFS transporter [Gaiellaceae bacterium]|nr:MFS transporter [Gaiellaceae bacterium]
MTGDEPRAVGLTLLAALAASQAGLVVLNPLLPDVARDLDVSIATAGQLRTVSGLAAGLAALAVGLLATRYGLRELLLGAVATLALGSVLSALAPGFAWLVVGQALAGVGIGVSYSAAIAAVADWSVVEDRSRVLALTLLGPPLAWILGMPIVGVLGEVSWRLAWLVVPLALAVVALALLAARVATAPARARAGLGAVLRYPGVARWSVGELLAFSGWAGSLVYVGALLVESYDLSVAATGFALGFGALVYVPGNLLFRRWVDVHGRLLLVGLAASAAVTVALLGLVRPSVWVSIVLFATLCFIAGGRTLAGSARGLGLAPELRLGVTGVRTAAIQSGYFVGAAVGGIALATGGYGALGLAFSALFVGAAIPHLTPLR